MITQSGRMLLLLFFGSRKRRKAGKKERKTLSPLHLSVNNSLAQAPRLALRLQQREDVALADGALDVAHDEAVLVVKELDADLGDLFFFFFLVLGFFGFEFLETRGAEEVSKERGEERDRRAMRVRGELRPSEQLREAPCFFSSSALLEGASISLTGSKRSRSRSDGLKRKTRPLEERRRWQQQQQLRAAAAARDRRFSIKQSMNHSSPFFLPVHASPCGR